MKVSKQILARVPEHLRVELEHFLETEEMSPKLAAAIDSDDELLALLDSILQGHLAKTIRQPSVPAMKAG